jgi:hypothetical protein
LGHIHNSDFVVVVFFFLWGIRLPKLQYIRVLYAWGSLWKNLVIYPEETVVFFLISMDCFNMR